MNKKVFLIFAGVFVFYYIFNSLTPLEFGDDYVYSFVWTGRPIYEPLSENVNRISSLCDLVSSQWTHYITWSGRTVAHTIAQFFLWKGKSVFNIINSFVSVLLVAELYWFINKGHIRCRYRCNIIFLLFLLLWMFTLGYGGIFFWVTGACNYLWTNVLLLGFVLSYVRKYFADEDNWCYEDKKPFIFLNFVFGVAAGWTNENSVLVVILVLCCYILFCRKNDSLERWMIAGLFGLITGYGLLMLAPGNMARLYAEHNSSSWNIVSGILKNLEVLKSVFIFQFFLWYFVLRGLFTLRKTDKNNRLLQRNVSFAKVIVMVSFTMSAIMLFSPAFPARSAFSGTIYLIMAAGILLRIQDEFQITIITGSAKKFLFCVCMTYFIFTAGYSLRNYYYTNLQVQELIDMVEKTDDQDRYKVLIVKKIKQPSDQENLLTGFHVLSHQLSEDETDWKNVALARYYAVKGIRAVESEEYGYGQE